MFFSRSFLPVCLLVLGLCLSACAGHHQQPSLYRAIGGQPTVEAIADHFIAEIEFNRTIFEYFKDSDVERFRSKFIEHLCFHTGGPCEYTGDSMVDVHTGMNITEADFNLTVDLLINAMTRAGVSHPLQNRVLALLAPMRSEIHYR